MARYRYNKDVDNGIDFENLEPDDYINIFLESPMSIGGVPGFNLQINICLVIQVGKFVKCYYGMTHEEEVLRHGFKNSHPDVLDLVPELIDHGYKLYKG